MDWFLYDRDLGQEELKAKFKDDLLPETNTPCVIFL